MSQGSNFGILIARNSIMEFFPLVHAIFLCVDEAERARTKRHQMEYRHCKKFYKLFNVSNTIQGF